MREIEMLELKREIQSKASSDIDQQQRDYFLRQQIKVLHDELGMDSPERDLDEIRLKASQKKWPITVRSHFEKELSKLQRIKPNGTRVSGDDELSGNTGRPAPGENIQKTILTLYAHRKFSMQTTLALKR